MDGPCAAPVVETAPLPTEGRVALVRCGPDGEQLVGLGRVRGGILRADRGVEVFPGDHVVPVPAASASLPPPRPARTLAVDLDLGAYAGRGGAVVGRAEAAWLLAAPLRVEARTGTASLGLPPDGPVWGHVGGTVGLGLDFDAVGVGLSAGLGPRTVDPADFDTTVPELDAWARLGREDATHARGRVVVYVDPPCWPGEDLCPGLRIWASGWEGELSLRVGPRAAIVVDGEAGDGGVVRGGIGVDLAVAGPWRARVGLGYGAFRANPPSGFVDSNGIGLTVGVGTRARVGGP